MIEFQMMYDWDIEIIDDKHPVTKEIWEVKKRVMIWLTATEWNEYMDLKHTDKEQYIKNKALEIFNK